MQPTSGTPFSDSSNLIPTFKTRGTGKTVSTNAVEKENCKDFSQVAIELIKLIPKKALNEEETQKVNDHLRKIVQEQASYSSTPFIERDDIHKYLNNAQSAVALLAFQAMQPNRSLLHRLVKKVSFAIKEHSYKCISPAGFPYPYSSLFAAYLRKITRLHGTLVTGIDSKKYEDEAKGQEIENCSNSAQKRKVRFSLDTEFPPERIVTIKESHTFGLFPTQASLDRYKETKINHLDLLQKAFDPQEPISEQLLLITFKKLANSLDSLLKSEFQDAQQCINLADLLQNLFVESLHLLDMTQPRQSLEAQCKEFLKKEVSRQRKRTQQIDRDTFVDLVQITKFEKGHKISSPLFDVLASPQFVDLSNHLINSLDFTEAPPYAWRQDATWESHESHKITFVSFRRKHLENVHKIIDAFIKIVFEEIHHNPS